MPKYTNEKSHIRRQMRTTEKWNKSCGVFKNGGIPFSLEFLKSFNICLNWIRGCSLTLGFCLRSGTPWLPHVLFAIVLLKSKCEGSKWELTESKVEEEVELEN